jgi:hypothetical protein
MQIKRMGKLFSQRNTARSGQSMINAMSAKGAALPSS